MLCSTRPAKEDSCALEEKPKPPEGCGIYDPNCDDQAELSGSITRAGLGIGFVMNPDGSFCLLIGPFAGWPVIAPTIHLGGMSE